MDHFFSTTYSHRCVDDSGVRSVAHVVRWAFINLFSTLLPIILAQSAIATY